MNEKDQKTQKGMSMKGQRTLAYIVLIIISFFCLFWFYVLFINATRSNGALKKVSQRSLVDFLSKTGRACLPEHFRYGMVCSTVFSLLPVLLFYVPISPP
mgnify:CR=1 FL=1